MAIVEFPPVELADQYGLLAVGGDLEIETLLLAYRNGIFPWPLNRQLLAWFAPPERAIIELADFHMPKSLHRVINRGQFRTTINSDFSGVIKGCAAAKNRKGQRGTWITPAMIAAYQNLHKVGFAYSVEVWNSDLLVGGLYGVRLGSFVAAESMFYRETNASKIALCALVEDLRQQGVSWFDVQVLTPTTEMFGAREISRGEFQTRLDECLS